MNHALMTLTTSEKLRTAQNMCQSKAMPDRRPVVCLLAAIPERRGFKPVPRTLSQRLRNRLRRNVDWLRWVAGLPVAFHYSDYEYHLNTNQGDIAIGLASRELITEAFAGAVEFLEIGWDELPQFDAEWLNSQIDLFVICGGGYYFVNAAGQLTSRIPRDLMILRELSCPIISLAPGFNRVFDPNDPDADLMSPDDQPYFKEILDLLALSSARDEQTRQILDLASPGRTLVVADPALFLAPSRSSPPRCDDGVLRVGLNVAFHGPTSSKVMPNRVRLLAAAARRLAQRQPCQFFYFVHSESEQLIPHLLRSEGVVVKVVDAPPAEMLVSYGQLDLHLCQMLHSSIFSFAAGVPTINLSYDIKNGAFFDLMGMAPYCLPTTTTAVELETAIEKMLAERETLRLRIVARRAELRGNLDAYLARMRKLVPAHKLAAC